MKLTSKQRYSIILLRWRYHKQASIIIHLKLHNWFLINKVYTHTHVYVLRVRMYLQRDCLYLQLLTTSYSINTKQEKRKEQNRIKKYMKETSFLKTIEYYMYDVIFNWDKGKFDRSRYDLLSPLSVFVPIDKSGILYRSPSKTMASQIWKSVV